MSRERYDIVIISPLEEEFLSTLDAFDSSESVSSAIQPRFEVKLADCPLRILVIQQSKMGKAKASEALLELTRDVDVGLIVCLGIAGGISPDVRIGDVIYSGDIVDVLENQKVRGIGTRLNIAFAPDQFESPKELSTAITVIKADNQERRRLADWASTQHEDAKALIPLDYPGRSGSRETVAPPRARKGIIACGMVSASPAYNDAIRVSNRRIDVIDTESGAVFAFAQTLRISAMTIRGVCDYADENKAKLEEETNGQARLVASNNAVSFLRILLTSPPFVMAVQGRLQPSLFSGTGDTSESLILESLKALDGEIDAKLKELSPAYDLSAKGYRLPIPRVRLREDRDTLHPGQISDPADIRDVIRDYRVLLLCLAKDYPDDSLPWVVARALRQNDGDEKPWLPIVISSNQLKLPKSGLDSAQSAHARKLREIGNFRPIFIICDFIFSSRTKTDFLKSEISALTDENVVIITRTPAAILYDGDFTQATLASVASVCDVSFAEMTDFIQKKHGMSRAQAEVVANKLQGTFHNFDLSAHPSYVAGISIDILSALLNANRRAELLQLAVAGYLSFVVADDQTHTRLSRTTREQFLTRLVWELKIEKRTFDVTSLMTFTRTFAAEFDYAIEPLSFVNAFIEKGILYFDNDAIRFTLPFMEAYLLAAALSKNSIGAKGYFNLDDKDFDLKTFSIYSELGPDPGIVNEIDARLQESVAALEARSAEGHILEDGSFASSLVWRQGRLKRLGDRIKKAAKDAIDNPDSTREKQRLLDLADKARTETARRKSDTPTRTSGEIAIEDKAILSFVTAGTLLGSGAERISATQKRSMIENILSLMELILDEWTRQHDSIDYEKVKANLLSGNIVVERLNSRSKGSVKESERTIEELVDLIRYYMLAYPLNALMYGICDLAGERVLSENIKNVPERDGLYAVLRGAWWADIDPDHGSGPLISALKGLPKAGFLRIVLAYFLISRVFWNHSVQKDRLQLLKVAFESSKELPNQYDERELRKRLDLNPPPKARKKSSTRKSPRKRGPKPLNPRRRATPKPAI